MAEYGTFHAGCNHLVDGSDGSQGLHSYCQRTTGLQPLGEHRNNELFAPANQAH